MPSLSAATARLWLDTVDPTTYPFFEYGNFASNTNADSLWWCIQDTPSFLWRQIDLNAINMLSAPISAVSPSSVPLFTPTAPFYVESIKIILGGVASFVSVPTLSLGTNGGAYDNIIPITPLTNLSLANTLLTIEVAPLTQLISAGVPIFVNVVQPAVAATYSINVMLRGRYL